MNNIDKTIFTSYEMVEAAFNNDLRAFDANGRMMKTRALKGTTYYFKSHKTGRRYDISAEECRMLNLFYNTWDALNKAQRADNMMVYYNGNVWWFERAELRRKVFEMIDGYIDAFEAWLDEKNEEEETAEEKNEAETVETVEKEETPEEETAEEETVEKNEKNEVSGEEKRELSKEEIEKAPDYMPVVGYEGLYEVGKDGSVWSLNYNHTGQRKQMVPVPYDKFGHQKVNLCKDGKMKTCKVHQLVLNAYLPKPSPELEVLHKNSTASDNRLENLRWGPHIENMNDSHFKTLISEAFTNHKDLSTPVLCEETGVVYPSVHEAERQTGIHQPNISKCLNGKRKTAGGFHWRAG